MSESDQITRHEREIGELRGKLDALATKEFVRQVVQEQTTELNKKFDAIGAQFAEVATELRAMNEKQHRITGAADILKTSLPMLISVATLIVLVVSLIVPEVDMTSDTNKRGIALSLETIVMVLIAVILMLTIVLTSQELEHRLDERMEAIRLEVKADIQRLEDRLLPVIFPPTED